MLRKIRIVAATICFTLITLLFLDFTGTLHLWFGWLAKIQFLPAVLALNVGVVAFLVILTLLFGRVYCSVICPLGVFQDIVSWISGKRKKNRFRYSPANSWLRYSMLALFIVALLAGFTAIAALIAPYSAYGRIASTLSAPLYQWGTKLLAYFAERIDSYAFYSTDVWLKSIPTFIIALVTFVSLLILAWKNGRAYCNTICPVGTVLGFLSKYSLFKPVIAAAKCNGCKLCARNCKASCINPEAHEIDYSRCVACMDCLESCRQGAISYTWRRRPHSASESAAGTTAAKGSVKSARPTVKAPAAGASEAAVPDRSRRRFLAGLGTVAVAATVRAQEMKVDGGLALIEEKKIPDRATPLTPPGSLSAHNLATHCTGCQLCISACPNGVLRPSGKLTSFMQPVMSYERGYCRPECTECSSGCPTGAITIVKAGPDDPSSRLIPVVDEERCIGCGACENLCPARPFSAIYVEGHLRHRTV